MADKPTKSANRKRAGPLRPAATDDSTASASRD